MSAAGSPHAAGFAHAAAPAPAADAAPRLPDFFVVGHAKSGTTALYAMLRQHPEIFLPDGKEPWYFASELHERTPPRPEGTPRTLQEYAALFAAARPEQRIGEASALYLWSRTAAQAIAQVKPDAKIVAILREPASFLRSLHYQFVEVYVETESDFRTAIELEGARREGREVPRHTYWPKALLYSEHVRYVEQLRRYEERFGRERMLVLIYDDFRADNERTVREVLRFVGVDDGVRFAVQEANPTVHVRSRRAHHLLHALSVGRGPVSQAAKASLKAVMPRRWRREQLARLQQRYLYTSPPPPNEGFMRELRMRFRGEVEALSEYLGRDLVRLWGYDELG